MAVPRGTAGAPGTPGSGGGSGPGRRPGWLDPARIARHGVIPVGAQAAGAPQALAFSPDGRMLASGGRVVALWDVLGGTALVAYEDRRSTAGIGDVSFSHGGTLLAGTDLDTDAITVWDIPSGRVAVSLTGAGPGKDRVAFSPDDALLAACTPRDVGVWDVAAGRLIAAEPVGSAGSVAFSPDGAILAVGAADRVLLREVVRAGSALRPRFPDLTVSMRQAASWGVALSPDGTVLAAAVSGPKRAGAVYLWGLPGGQPLGQYASSKGLVALAFSPAGDVIATVEDLRCVRLWDTRSGRLAATLDSPATCLAFSPDGTYLAAGCTREIHVWTAASASGPPAAVGRRPAAGRGLQAREVPVLRVPLSRKQRRPAGA